VTKIENEVETTKTPKKVMAAQITTMSGKEQSKLLDDLVLQGF
jgi:hypothetical protein